MNRLIKPIQNENYKESILIKVSAQFNICKPTKYICVENSIRNTDEFSLSNDTCRLIRT